MKIAQIVPLMKTVPPGTYGGIERVVTWLTDDLLKQGHKVTLFAARGSGLRRKHLTVEACSPYPTAHHMEENRKWEVGQFQKIIASQTEFDVIHFHYEPFILKEDSKTTGPALLESVRTPAVFTFHNLTYIPQRIAFYRLMPQNNNFHFVFISKNQRLPLDFLPNSRVIYNGIPLETFPFENASSGYLFFIGRAAPVKGIQDAILTAARANRKLFLAASVGEDDRRFYESEITEYINKTSVVNVGDLNQADKLDYLKNASALLFPVHWEEPFGLVMAEAMACGTPVIAYARGSVPEIVKDGETGFIVNESAENKRGNWITKTTGIAGLCEAVERLYRLPPDEMEKMRLRARRRIRQHFQSAAMSQKYMRLYERIAG